jgi:hypothetical protein
MRSLSNVKDILDLLSTWSIVLPLLLGLVRLTVLSRDSKIVWGIVALGAIPQLLPPFKEDVQNVTYNLYTPLEFFMVYLLFYNKYRTRLARLVFRGSVAVSILFSVLFWIRLGVSGRFISELVCVNNLLYTTWTLAFITEQFSADDMSRLSFRWTTFWYIAAYFLYAPCTILIYSLWDYINENRDSPLNDLRIIHYIFNISLYVFFTIGFLKDGQPRGAVHADP